ncbi:MarR family transcriptional regulator [Paenibacillus sp. N3/727]|uniref:MarR family transcriptional regulator n=1 Tax=Paenibacillus sp. N3/727 TaxID=2925845 RepID=UPI001F53A091|nr:MarR family transcriptional regulator [Paenibacillus sp. N3/727]UNK19537.1 MarR family transcriptional regulator [Paenibacillus sp. N3/727]
MNHNLTKHEIYHNYLHFLHLNEQKADRDIQMFYKQAAQEELPYLPTNMTSLHVIACIGEHQPINNIAIAKKMNLSKANITKISTKLIKEGLITRFQSPDNKKEIYFELTSKGHSLFELHEKIHKQKEKEFYAFIDTFSQSEQKVILKFLQDMTHRITEN